MSNINMVHLPPHLAMYRQEAEQSLEQGLVKDVEFSGSTYQVLVEDLHTHEQFWVFMQLEGKGHIKDAFCACEETSQDVPCLHLAVAYLSLFGPYEIPLHQRFIRSLWNHICRLCSDRIGDDSSALTHLAPGYYASESAQETLLFSIKAKTDEDIQHVEDLLSKRTVETEETSLKFSNLTPDEIQLWREGHPSSQLRYDISFWSDLAKWLLKLQENDGYEISFQYSSKGMPNWLQADFPSLNVGFYLAEPHLASLIPSLATVKSSLIVQSTANQGIERIYYDKAEGKLHIVPEGKIKEARHPLPEGGMKIGGWLYLPQKGFYAQEPHLLLKQKVLKGDELADALTEHTRLISSLMTDYVIHADPVKISYELAFDKSWNLHAAAYLFEPGDLTKGHSALIQNWAFLDGDGFYRIKGKRFPEAETAIPIYQVADFITQHRTWLNTIEGFHIHVKSLEYQLTYQVSENNRLTFSRSLTRAKERARVQDFGPWVYVEGVGFYSKTAGSFNFLLRPGISLSPEQIPLFIRMNQEELAVIPGFFSDECPVVKTSLRVDLNVKQQQIKVIPEYALQQGYKEQNVHFFDEYVYVKEEGFSLLPLELRLPERFRHEVEIEGEDLNLFIQYELNEIRKFVSYLDPRLIKSTEIQLKTESIVPALDKGRGWYRFKFYYQTERGTIPILALYQALKKKQAAFAFFDAGLLDLQEPRWSWLRELKKDRLNKEDDSVLLSTLEFMRLNAFDPVSLIDQPSGPGYEKSAAILEDLTQLHTPAEPDIGGLVSHLRPYQEIGVKWLWFLYHQHLSGLLCDDMGLGKTHQAMALLTSVANLYRLYAEGTKHYFLIVCPTSVIYHWQEKLEQFLPGLHVHTFYGTKRSLDEFHEKGDILLTSYGIIRNEKELLSKIPFEIAIFDEIQVAKNQQSRIYNALLHIKAQMKLGLTGTPIENHLRELKSLFDIVLPGYLPGESEYRDLFIRPIEREHNPHRKALLNRVIKPFVLRRKKEDVLKELPEKIEEIAYCDLHAHQRHLYSDVLEQRRKHLMEELRDEKNPIPYLHIFALLSSLKQICDHPAVYLKTPQEYQKYQSGKWDLFVELLREAQESEQKVVVFSQYLGMLDIVEQYLAEQDIGFASLRGSTQNRKEQIRLFNHDPTCRVFVGSLHAAGLGVDLTAGSVVIHYDRWWNAARENQATDRVHRIGQTRGVQVFKLVTKGTFEEKIDAMIERKGQLMEDVVGIDDQYQLKRFSRDELIDLLSLVETGREHKYGWEGEQQGTE